MQTIRRLLPLLLLAWLTPGYAGGLTEEQVKAAYVFNFIKFVEWPSGQTGDNGEMVLCVVGAEPLGDELGALDGRQAGGRKLRVVRHESGDDLGKCQAVFVRASLKQRGLVILKSLDGAPVLVISDMENFAERGGDIGLFYRENKTLFEINLASLRKKKLQLPAQVLNLAANIFGRVTP